VDKDLKVTGDLAENWEISDNGLKIIFHLKKNIFWHDGEPFTSKDVAYTYNTILDSQTACPYISSYKNIKKIEIPDDYSITFIYDKPYTPALLKFGMGIIPEHIFKKEKDIRRSLYARNPVGTGPYIFSKWISGDYILLEANTSYFEHPPGIKYYVYRIIPDQAVQFFELISGGIDSMDLNPYQYKYRSETDSFKRDVVKYKYLSHSYTYLAYNLSDPVFSDIRIRKALSMAINKKEIIDSVLLGAGEECTGPFLKGTEYYDPGIKDVYDVTGAKLLLREAGWTDEDSDGVLEKDGREFYIKIATNQGNQVREDTAAIIQKQWEKIGVKADIQVVAWAAFLDQFVTRKNFQVIIMGWTIPADPDPYSVWHSDSITAGGVNFISYSNCRVDELIEKGRMEFDISKRAAIYKQVHRLIYEDFPYTFLFFPYATPAINKRFKGIKPAPAGIGYNFIDWYVPENEVRYKF
jgi:peptide/nickel transport system substrate-binding protein